MTVVLSLWAAMHLYVFWRLMSVPWLAAHCSRRALFGIAVCLWMSYPLARLMSAWSLDWAAYSLELAAATWLGVLFLLLSALLAVELITAGGWVLPHLAPGMRGWAAVAAGALSIFGLIQGLRAPVVRHYELHLPGLPREQDGLILAAISDLHLGTLIGRGWAGRLVNRVEEIQPDLVVVIGDVVDGNVARVQPMLAVLRSLRAPLGVWAVTGNHEFYAGLEGSVALLEAAGFSVLRDRSVQVAPGLILAGVDDLTARQQFGLNSDPLRQAIADRPPGATILLSHSPWQAETAAAAGVALMLSGHTHNGQIWPFNFLVKLRYPLLGGYYEIEGMSVIVCRGTGTWGPRMRLWGPSEILRIKLRVKS